MTLNLFACLASMASPATRGESASRLASYLGADDLIVFVFDPEIAHLLPAPGFPQTLRSGALWHELLERAVREKAATADLPSPDGRVTTVRAHAAADGSVVALLGGSPNEVATATVMALLPLLGALFLSESSGLRAGAEAGLARESAAAATVLAEKLDRMRSELHQALTLAETATRARDEFLATVSHELRTPLTSILGWVQLLRNDPEGGGLLGEGLDTIERNAKSQALLIEDILDFSRINAGKLRLEVRPTDLVDVIQAAVEVVRTAANAKRIRIETILDPNAGAVSGDPERLQQVVWNLLSNSLKFTPSEGRVQVRLERIDSSVELTVADTGQGIPTEFLPYVFDRFSQADSSSTRTHSGLGLGLGIVKHLVDLHGGTVQAFSEGQGKGSTFVIRMPTRALKQGHPLPAVSDASAVHPSAAGSFPDLSGITVLVVEDNEDARHLLTKVFERCKATVFAASGAGPALEALNAVTPDVLVSDIEMAGEDGYSLIRKIRLLPPPISRIPAIALTAYTRSVDRVRALSAGFQAHVAKPVEMAELATAVKSLVGATKPAAKS